MMTFTTDDPSKDKFQLQARKAEPKKYVASDSRYVPSDALENVGKLAEIFPEKTVSPDTGKLDLYRQRTGEKQQNFKSALDRERSPEELKRLEKLDWKRACLVADRVCRRADALERQKKGKPCLMDLAGLRFEAEKEKEKTVNAIVDAKNLAPLDKYARRMEKLRLLGVR